MRLFAMPRLAIASSFSATTLRSRVNLQLRRRKVLQQARIGDFLRPGRDRVAVADIELHGTTNLAEEADELHAQAAVLRVVPDLLDRDRLRVERDAVVDGEGAHVAHVTA
jgi:hypothetical protein